MLARFWAEVKVTVPAVDSVPGMVCARLIACDPVRWLSASGNAQVSCVLLWLNMACSGASAAAGANRPPSQYNGEFSGSTNAGAAATGSAVQNGAFASLGATIPPTLTLKLPPAK